MVSVQIVFFLPYFIAKNFQLLTICFFFLFPSENKICNDTYKVLDKERRYAQNFFGRGLNGIREEIMQSQREIQNNDKGQQHFNNYLSLSNHNIHIKCHCND